MGENICGNTYTLDVVNQPGPKFVTFIKNIFCNVVFVLIFSFSINIITLRELIVSKSFPNDYSYFL